MNKRVFPVLVALVAIFLGWVVIAGQHLPSTVRAEIDGEQTSLSEAKQKIASQQQTVKNEAAQDPELFQVKGFDQQVSSRFNQVNISLGEADRVAAQLATLKQKNRRSSRDQVEDLLHRERDLRAAATSQADAIARSAQTRADLKQHFPETVHRLQSEAHALAGANYVALTAKVEKAERDWPRKKDDLQSRLDAFMKPKAEASHWEEAATALAAKPAGQITAADYAQAIDMEEGLEQTPRAEQAGNLMGLSQQLYTSWDNVLEDLDKDHGQYRERIKHIVTTVPEPSAKGSTASEQMWRDVSQGEWQVAEKNVGMAINHKPLGAYDSEADSTPQPPGFAYMASPSEGRNQYGYWDNRGGNSVWTWLPQYLILRDLLSNRYYSPVPSYDWDRYSEARRYGKTYYGRNTDGATKYGSHGTFTLQRYGNSRYMQSGGFSGSKYSSGGGFSGSRYGSGSSPSFRPSGSTAGGSRFGSSPYSSGSHRYGSSSGGMKFGSGSRSSGRSFGGGRRR